ncbi:TBCD [Pyrrhoderma noxium]|uniref:TBCD n=1 Tax=Pyrrhoderma noxium TaxID=2282107 RepID=A0A286UC57_9AGAM|nr:TBCD [Pyrrhoderma noxium]
MTDEESEFEPKVLGAFEKSHQTSLILNNLISLPITATPSPDEDKLEAEQLRQLIQILDEYQEQPYLLDPHLEALITPIVNTLRIHAREYALSHSTESFSSARINRLSEMLYTFVKVRGYKTVVRFFPHEVADLTVASTYMTLDGPVKDADNWQLRYLILLWLSLVCKLPFDLAQFDSEDTASIAETLEKIGKSELDKSGVERDGAALMLSRLYMRKDTCTLLPAFLEFFENQIHASSTVFLCIGSLKVLAEIVKSAPLETIESLLPRIRNLVKETMLSTTLSRDTIIRKLCTKCISRIATRMLPPTIRNRGRNRKTLILTNNEELSESHEEEDIDVPVEIEETFEELFELVQDKDTTVRWSSAKGLARISERLPDGFVEQILDNILGFFETYSGGGLSPTELSPAAEHPWHGACLALAEMARRDLITDSRFSDVLMWMSKALFFDVRKGSFSVGSNVRDATAYVLWSLARTQGKYALESHAHDLAKRLVTVSVFDREIHVRRAASAAFQEHVGRMGLFPHGIAIIGIADFYSVSIRRNAFLKAAPQIASYKEYTEATLKHLTEVTLRHWDVSMRSLGAQSLKKVCELNLEEHGPQTLGRLSVLLRSVDTTDVHGALLALGELAESFCDSKNEKLKPERQKAFALLNVVPPSMSSSQRNHLITEAMCCLIANALSPLESSSLDQSSQTPYWKKVIDQGLRHKNSSVQEAAAQAMLSLNTLITELKHSSPITQQSLARVLGCLDYSSHNNGLGSALNCLLDVVTPKSSSFFRDVEARRNAYLSLGQLVKNVSLSLDKYITPKEMSSVFDALYVGLEDYTVNERGDVGVWKDLTIGGKEWAVKNREQFEELFFSNDIRDWSDGAWLYSKATRLLDVKEYRIPVMRGFLMSIASKTSSTQQPASEAILAYARSLPFNDESTLDDETENYSYDLSTFISDLLLIANENPKSNALVIPILHTFNILLEGDVFLSVPQDKESDLIGLLSDIHNLSTKNIDKIKNIQRVEESMKVIVNMIPLPYDAPKTQAVTSLRRFLLHTYPTVRSATAEALYITLQTKYVDFDEEAEEILLGIEWASDEGTGLEIQTTRLITCLS